MANFSHELSVAVQVGRIKRKIKAIAPSIRPAVQAQIEQDARALVAQQKSAAPVLTGELRDDIDFAPLKKPRIGVTVYSGDWKSRWLEFGTEKMRAQPYFFPPWRARKKQIKANERRAIKAAGKKAVT